MPFTPLGRCQQALGAGALNAVEQRVGRRIAAIAGKLLGNPVRALPGLLLGLADDEAHGEADTRRRLADSCRCGMKLADLLLHVLKRFGPERIEIAVPRGDVVGGVR